MDACINDEASGDKKSSSGSFKRWNLTRSQSNDPIFIIWWEENPRGQSQAPLTACLCCKRSFITYESGSWKRNPKHALTSMCKICNLSVDTHETVTKIRLAAKEAALWSHWHSASTREPLVLFGAAMPSKVESVWKTKRKGVLVTLSSSAEESKCVRRSWSDSDPQLLHFKGLPRKKVDFSSVLSLKRCFFLTKTSPESHRQSQKFTLTC